MPHEQTIRARVNGTTFMGVYEVIEGALALTSLDFGDRVAPLHGAAPRLVAERMLRSLAEAAMRRNDPPFMRDDETA